MSLPHCTHALFTHTPEGQSALPVHATQVCVAGLQTGVVPPQSVAPTHCTQVLLAGSQTVSGALGHCALEVHSTQAPASVSQVRPVGQFAPAALQPTTHTLLVHIEPGAHWVSPVHSTQVCVDGSHCGRVGSWQSVFDAHSPHTPVVTSQTWPSGQLVLVGEQPVTQELLKQICPAAHWPSSTQSTHAPPALQN